MEDLEQESAHIPVLLNEVLEALDPQTGENVVDCTVGLGGHAAAMLERTSPDGKLLGLDLDEAALGTARSLLARFGSRVMLVRENYRNVARVLLSRGFGPIHAALLDLGYSSLIIDDARRGFSFRHDGPLDMRFDDRTETTAAELVNTYGEDDLARILWDYGEERHARRIAKAMLAARRIGPIVGTHQLRDIVAPAVPAWYRRQRLHFATKTFQALRIAVNDELGGLEAALPDLLDALAPGGRIAVISFHSLEDRIVKRMFAGWEKEGRAEVLTAKPLTATLEEVSHNPRARSAKLRVVRKAQIP